MFDSPNDPVMCPKCRRQVSYRVRGLTEVLCSKCHAHLTIVDDGKRLRIDLLRREHQVTDKPSAT